MSKAEWFGPAKTHRLGTGDNTMLVGIVGPQVMCSTVTGTLTLETAKAFTHLQEPMFKEGKKLSVFHNWWDMTGYEPEVRTFFTEYTNRHLEQLDEIHILLRSTLVIIGVRTANLILRGRINAHGNPDKFFSMFARSQDPSA